MKTTKPIAVAISIWLVLWLLVALYGAMPARAGWQIDRATAIAAKVWRNPCPGGLTLQWSQLPANLPAVGPNLEVAGWVDPAESCVVHMHAGLVLEWDWFCTIVIHEVGHVAGQQHVDRPGSVMNAAPPMDRRCADRGRPYLGLR